MNKIKKHLKGFWRAMFIFFFIAFIPQFFNIIHYFTPASDIWGYSKIESEGQAKVGELAIFRGYRYNNNGPLIMYFLEALICSDGVRKVHEYKPFPFNEANTLEEGKPFTFAFDYRYTIPGTDCILRSCQTTNYYGYEKKQCFDSLPFDIVE